jgi:hypothetical protein
MYFNKKVSPIKKMSSRGNLLDPPETETKSLTDLDGPQRQVHGID